MSRTLGILAVILVIGILITAIFFLLNKPDTIIKLNGEKPKPIYIDGKVEKVIYKEYNATTRSITIRNETDIFAVVTLLTPLHNYVPVGNDIQIAELRFDIRRNVQNFVGAIESFDNRKNLRELNKVFDMRYVRNIYNVSIPDYSTSCSNVNEDNGTYQNCTSVVNGTRLVTAKNWSSINWNVNIPANNYTVGIFANVSVGDYVEWVPNIGSLRVTEWASFEGYDLEERNNQWIVTQGVGVAIDNNGPYAQCFTVGTSGANVTADIVGVELWAWEVTNTGNGQVWIANASMIAGVCTPTNFPNTYNSSVVWSALGTSTNGESFNISLPAGFRQQPGQTYAIIANVSTTVATGYVRWASENTINGSSYRGGNASQVGSISGGNYVWQDVGNRRLRFKLYGSNISIPPPDINVTLVSPTDTFKSTNSQIAFNFTALTNLYNVTNYTFSLWNSSGGFINKNITNLVKRLCIQRLANETTCGQDENGYFINGLEGGAHTNIPFESVFNSSFYDGNFNTFSNVITPSFIREVSYIVPYGTINAFLTIKDSENGLIAYNVTSSIYNNKIRVAFIGIDTITRLAGNTLGQTIGSSSSSALYYEISMNYTLPNNYNYISVSKNRTIPDGNYSWGIMVSGNDSSGNGGSAFSSNFTFFIDSIRPNVTVFYPNNSIIPFATAGQNISLEFLARDTNLNSCWFSYDGINKTVGCNANSSFILTGDRTFRFFANDTFNNVNYTTINLNISILELNQTVAGSVYETQNQNLTYNISFDPNIYTGASAQLVYNGTAYSTTSSGSNGNLLFTKSFDAQAINVQQNVSFYWIVSITSNSGTSQFNSSLFSQIINKIYFVSCNATYNATVVNYTIYDELSKTIINATVGATFNYWLGTGTTYQNYTYSNLTTTNAKFCTSPTNLNFTTNALITLSSSSYATNYYNFFVQQYSNRTTEQPLYMLSNGNATVTDLYVVNEQQAGQPNKLVRIELYSPGTDTYDLVGIAKTNFAGKDVVYFNYYNSLYRFTITDLNNNILKIFEPFKVSANPLYLRITSPQEYDYRHFQNLTWSLTYSNVTDNIVLTWNDPSNQISAGCLRVSTPGVQNYTIWYNTCYSGTTGTLSFSLNGMNGTFFAEFYATGSSADIDVIQIIKNIHNEITDSISKKDRAVYAFMIVGATFFLGLLSPVIGLVAIFIGFAVASTLGFLDLTSVTTWFIGGIGLWALYLAWKMRT